MVKYVVGFETGEGCVVVYVEADYIRTWDRGTATFGKDNSDEAIAAFNNVNYVYVEDIVTELGGVQGSDKEPAM